MSNSTVSVFVLLCVFSVSGQIFGAEVPDLSARSTQAIHDAAILRELAEQNNIFAVKQKLDSDQSSFFKAIHLAPILLVSHIQTPGMATVLHKAGLTKEIAYSDVVWRIFLKNKGSHFYAKVSKIFELSADEAIKPFILNDDFNGWEKQQVVDQLFCQGVIDKEISAKLHAQLREK